MKETLVVALSKRSQLALFFRSVSFRKSPSLPASEVV